MLSSLFIAALWSPAGKGLTSWLLFVISECDVVTFPCDILGQVWYLTVLILIFAVFLTFIGVNNFIFCFEGFGLPGFISPSSMFT